jgi:hypothetical protein
MTAAYDEERNVVVLYGGRIGAPGQSGSFLYDTWIWDGSTWVQPKISSGPVLFVPTAAYDPISKQVILFGQSAQGGEAQTWGWDGKSWQLLRPTLSPSGRYGVSMAFDSATNRLLLFGGDQNLGAIGETWAWDGSTWEQLAPAKSPSPRYLAAMGSTGPTPGLVLFGGADRNQVYGDTWKWDGNTWTQLAPSHTPHISLFPTAFDTGSQLELIASNGEVWAWDGTDWSKT